MRAHLYENLIAFDEKLGGAPYRLIVTFDPRYNTPLVLLTKLNK